ncbi:MAG: Gfo/Idh/MocA family oxidoreductase [Pseudomonadota bacterium]
MSSYRWGIIAPGNIANRFAEALQGNADAECYAVAGRSLERTKAFADRHGFQHSYVGIDDLMADPNVDVIYIASPHSAHMEQSIACLRGGKPTLCEKPMTINAQQASAVTRIAAEHNTFYMEAMWTRCLPIYDVVRDWLEQERIGDIKLVQATFGFQRDFEPTHRLYDPELAGGALLDMGIYPITFSHWVYQQDPESISALGHIGESGVDEQLAIALKYPNGRLAQLGSAITANTNHDGWIYGSRGKIKLHAPFWGSEAATLYEDIDAAEGIQKSPETITRNHTINGFEGEIAEVHRCLDLGLLESPRVNWQTSLSIMMIMDEIRQQLGLRYPMES